METDTGTQAFNGIGIRRDLAHGWFYAFLALGFLSRILRLRAFGIFVFFFLGFIASSSLLFACQL